MKIIILAILSLNSFAFDQSHKAFDRVLKSYTSKKDQQVRVNYSLLKKNKGDLVDYLKKLEGLKRSDFDTFSQNEKLAFWINAYNAYTLKLIIDNYPVKSIKDIGSLFTNPWKKEFINLFGEKVSLDFIEHETIRKNFNEPRIHFAVNCASVGCPSLFQDAFVASNLDKQLEAATNFFLNNRKKNYYDKTKNKLFLSKIFDWYGDDFKDKFGSYKKFVTKYIETPKNVDVKFLDYDWNLNE